MIKDLDYYMKLPWTFRFEWSNEDDCYVASISELKGCMSHGDTLQEASEMIQDALLSHLSACIEAKIQIPEPVRPADFKGKIPYRTTPQIHYKLAQRSAITGKSINALIDEAVQKSLKESA